MTARAASLNGTSRRTPSSTPTMIDSRTTTPRSTKAYDAPTLSRTVLRAPLWRQSRGLSADTRLARWHQRDVRGFPTSGSASSLTRCLRGRTALWGLDSQQLWHAGPDSVHRRAAHQGRLRRYRAVGIGLAVANSTGAVDESRVHHPTNQQ